LKGSVSAAKNAAISGCSVACDTLVHVVVEPEVSALLMQPNKIAEQTDATTKIFFMFSFVY
jgi:hypothetical protein